MTRLAKQSFLLIFVAITLIFALVGFSLADHSLAWFAKNETVTANGISVSAKISPNLVIGKSDAEISQGEISFSVDFSDTTRTNMIAVTHDNSVPDTFLKYLSNHYAVDNVTGNVKDGMTLEFEPVPNTENEAYFIDYTVYIASAFYALEVSSLSATITAPTTVDAAHPYFNAISIDFYVGTVSADTYRGTTSVSDSLQKTDRASIELLPGGATIPLNTEGSIQVIMRCYFDGALQNSATNTAYVNSYTVSTDSALIGVDFTAVDAQATE